jgi:hypothetical protein
MRSTLTVVLVSIAGLVGSVNSASAQTPEKCIAALTALKLPVPAANPCVDLIGQITFKATKAAGEVVIRPDPVSQRDLQSRAQQSTALGGTPAQGQAIPSVQPAGVAAGTIAAFGTNSNQEALAALSLNPAVLFLGDLASQAFAKASRVADVTIFVPVTMSKTETGSGTDTPTTGSSGFQYFGARVRVNVNGLKAGDAVWAKADELISKFTDQTRDIANQVTAALAAAADASACAVALYNDAGADAITAGCGHDVVLVADLDGAERLRAALTDVRRKADSKYFGADIRMDFGDPTLGAVENAAGNFLFAGLSAGARRDGAGPNGLKTYSLGMRARLGARHAKLDSEPDAELAIEWGAGIELVRFLGDDEVNVSLGFEGRHGNSDQALFSQLQTNVVLVRTSISLPLTTGNHIGINLSYPVAGKGRDSVSPTFSVTFNWALILAKEVRR